MKKLVTMKKSQKGQGVVEYAGALALATVVVAAGYSAINNQLGPGLLTVMTTINGFLTGTVGGYVP